MSWLDDVRRRKQEQDQNKPKEAPKTPAPKQEGKKKHPPRESIIWACGCKEGLKALSLRKCPACSLKDKKASKARARNKARKKLEQKLSQTPRLPNGSVFHYGWDEQKGEWTGYLEVPESKGSVVFYANAPGEKKLPWLLDKQYREWLKQKAEGAEKKEEGQEKSA